MTLTDEWLEYIEEALQTDEPDIFLELATYCLPYGVDAEDERVKAMIKRIQRCLSWAKEEEAP